MGTDSAHDEVIAVLQDLARAIANGDVGSVLASFWDSDQTMMVGSEQGETAFGRDALRQLWTRVLSRGQCYTLQWYDERVASAGSVAWLSARAVVTLVGTQGQRDLPYRATLVLIRPVDRWVIAQYHGSEPAAAW